ncbi:hypothetical protein PXH69_21600 [Rhodococcus qingshengii]|uniref:Uncharacterized protein n=1 Tax=Rhodococcus qingshengii TaxID=334542 RepID=A0AAW6LSY9_RHOSG|nr:hypothetical protein [Rhodococcus qingshengii]MDE8647573.1 hypothetical protein [Rhodococcus qingshengii]
MDFSTTIRELQADSPSRLDNGGPLRSKEFLAEPSGDVGVVGARCGGDMFQGASWREFDGIGDAAVRNGMGAQVGG